LSFEPPEDVCAQPISLILPRFTVGSAITMSGFRISITEQHPVRGRLECEAQAKLLSPSLHCLSKSSRCCKHFPGILAGVAALAHRQCKQDFRSLEASPCHKPYRAAIVASRSRVPLQGATSAEYCIIALYYPQQRGPCCSKDFLEAVGADSWTISRSSRLRDEEIKDAG
jgi:hypothetical protein